jgi:hypothetical protein
VLNYVNHDITYYKKFLELLPNNFLINSISSETHMIVIKPQMLPRGLQKVAFINLFNIPHFGWILDINACVKMLLPFVHGGYIWLDRLVSIDIDLIVCITGLASQEEDPKSLSFDKNNENTLYGSMKEKFHIQQNGKLCNAIIIL